VGDVLSWSAGGVAAVSSTSDVVEVPLDAASGAPPTVFVKRYRYDRFGQRFKQAFRGTLFGKSRAHREFDFLTEMRRRQIPTVRPIAFGDNYGHAFLRASFLITEGSAGYQSLDLFALDALRRGAPDRSKRRELIHGLAATIRKMHDAGIRHGGLYWRNILVRERPDGGYDFLLLDPDTHARLNDSQVPRSAVAADLSEVVASAMAIGQRTGLPALMKSYFQVSRLSAEHRALISQIIDRARTLAPSERRRFAVTEAIEWLRRRADGVVHGNQRARVYKSLDDFFDAVSCGTPDSTLTRPAGKTIRFSFSDTNNSNEMFDRTVIMDDAQLTIVPVNSAGQDLLIRTDPNTWLAVVSGHVDAYARLRSGRLRMEGDPTVLITLMEHLDRMESTELAGTDTTGPGAGTGSARREEPTSTEKPRRSPERQFGRKYKADDYAQYYAKKHDAGMGRRISNHFEAAMIRRSLMRVRRHHAFESVLDCPSGTGRFLPTLASLGVTVVAMDTSAAMLREGRRFHPLFKEPPVELVGSASAIDLPDDAVDVVLCSRLLHHIADREKRLQILREFARVARVGVVLSFFDSCSFRAWRRERKNRRRGKLSGRHAMTRRACMGEAATAGLKPLGMNALLRFHTEITAAAFLC